MTGSFVAFNDEELYNVNMEKKERKPNRLKDYDYSQNGAYFITICTKDRKPILSQISVGNAALSVPQIELTSVGKIVDNHIKLISDVDNYVIMPNHIHILITKNGTPGAAFPTNYLNNYIML